MATALLALRDIAVRHGKSTVLGIPSLEVYRGEVLTVIGPNGAGKSTLLRIMGLLQQPTTGKVYFAGEEATGQNAFSLRRRMASVFQEALLLNASVFDNAALGLKLRGLRRQEIEARLLPWLKRLGIAHLGSRPAHSLSGGEARRTSLARSFALDPELLLLDEPFSALDPPTREALLIDLQAILRETGVTTVLVTHDRNEAFMMGQRVGVLSAGKVLQLGSDFDVFKRPLSEEVAEIVGVDNRIPAVIESVADGIAMVRFDGGTAWVSGNFAPSARVVLCIRSEEISLTRGDVTHREPNGATQVQVKVVNVSPWGLHYRLTLQSDHSVLIALAARSSFLDLCPRVGEWLVASFSPEAVHVIRQSAPCSRNSYDV